MPTSRWIFVLGREPELSVAEIAAVAARHGVALRWQAISDVAAIAEGAIDLQLFQELAGCVKLAEVVAEAPVDPAGLTAVLQQLLSPNHGSRVEFGFSWTSSREPKWLRGVGLTLKRELKAGGHVRFVVSREGTLSSVVVQKNRLLPPGGYDFVLLPAPGNRLIVGRTVAVQDFAGWSERDFGRPARAARVGMLPPKLARLMVNLATTSLDSSGTTPGPGGHGHHPAIPSGAQLKQLSCSGGLLDPFCGSGTVLQEAALLGVRDLTGADADVRGLTRTRENLAWLKERHAGLPEPKLLTCDIRQLPARLAGHTYQAIATEPYLGPPFTGHEDERRLREIHAELTELYRVTLKVLGNLLAPGGRICMVWPVLRSHGREYPLELTAALGAAKLALVNLLPTQAPAAWRTERGPLRYERPDQHVVREVALLERG